ncbi:MULTISPECIES: AAA family ATPase [Fervidobacterium]|nr:MULTISPECIES: MoxR family ATPase [Fervidobacterium]KAF2960856.1 hypothetical protein AS161_03975 [Fervidobacterium sp. 2310opik-2]
MATTSELFEILPAIMSAGEVPMLVGHAGVGKTEVIRSIGRKYNREVIVLSLSQMEPGDLIGMPTRDGDKTIWLRPEWWPKDGNTILFLDEINRSHETVRAAIMQLLLDRRLNTHVLPEGTWLAAAMNPETDKYEVNVTIDQAYIDRFVWFKVVNKFDDWEMYALNNVSGKGEMYIRALESVYKLDSSVFQMPSDFNLPEIVPTPRAHMRAAKLFQCIDERIMDKYGFEILKGIIGKKYANLLLKQLRMFNNPSLSVEDLLSYNQNKIKSVTPQMRMNTAQQLVNYIIDNNLTDEQCFNP